MYSTQNKVKFVIAERFISTLKNKTCKYMTSVTKNMYIDKLDNIVNKYNNTYHNTVEMKPDDVKSHAYLDFSVGKNGKDTKFEVSDHVRISKYKYVFAKGYNPNFSEVVFVIKKIKSTVVWTYAISDLNFFKYLKKMILVIIFQSGNKRIF